MRIGLLISIALCVGIVLGVVGQRMLTKSGPFRISLDYPNRNATAPTLAPGSELACSAYVMAQANANFAGEKLAVARATRDDQKVSLKLTPDGKGLSVMWGSSVEAGSTDAGDPYSITYQDKNYVVAARPSGLDLPTIMLDRRTLKGVWGYTGLGMLGMEAYGGVLQCH